MTIVLLRPLAGSSAMWGRFRERLEARGAVVALEHTTRASTRAMAADVVRALDARGIDRAHVFGISLGGMVATWVAVDAPARVDRLVLASTLPRGAGARVRAPLALAACFVRGERAAARCLARRLLSDAFERAHPDEARRIVDRLAAEPLSRGALAIRAAAAARHDARAALARIAAPTLVLCGTEDPLITPASQRRLLAAIPDATFDVIPGAGHALTLEQPDATADRVLAFVS